MTLNKSRKFDMPLKKKKSNQTIFFSGWEKVIKYSEIFFDTPDISVMVRVFAKGPGDLDSIPGRVIPKTQKNRT